MYTRVGERVIATPSISFENVEYAIYVITSNIVDAIRRDSRLRLSREFIALDWESFFNNHISFNIRILLICQKRVFIKRAKINDVA